MDNDARHQSPTSPGRLPARRTVPSFGSSTASLRWIRAIRRRPTLRGSEAFLAGTFRPPDLPGAF
ncbi:MAG: hypothetical protein R3F11_15755 [Verrucomicrobiales bacterium]